MISIIEQNKPREALTFKCVIHFMIAVVWVFFLLYQPPLPISVIYILSGVSIGYIIMSLLSEPQVHCSFFRYIGAFLLILLYLLFVTAINQQDISNFSHVFWMMFCLFPSGYAVSRFLRNEAKSFDYFFHIILCAALLQAFIAMLSLTIPSFRSNIFDLMKANGLYDEKHIATWGYRIYGYGTSLMYSIPIIQGLIAGWALIYGMQKGKAVYYIESIFILFTAIINAKISVFVFGFVFILGFAVIKKATYKKIFSLCLIFLVGYFAFSMAKDYLLKTNDKLLEWIRLLLDTTSVDEYYTSYYMDFSKWKLPGGLDSLIGLGTTTDTYGIDVDMGFINDIWLGGFIYLSFIIYILSRLVRDIKLSTIYSHDWKKYMAWTLVGVFIIADIKGTAFSYSAYMALFIFTAMFGFDFGFCRRD